MREGKERTTTVSDRRLRRSTVRLPVTIARAGAFRKSPVQLAHLTPRTRSLLAFVFPSMYPCNSQVPFFFQIHVSCMKFCKFSARLAVYGRECLVQLERTSIRDSKCVRWLCRLSTLVHRIRTSRSVPAVQSTARVHIHATVMKAYVAGLHLVRALKCTMSNYFKRRFQQSYHSHLRHHHHHHRYQCRHRCRYQYRFMLLH